MFWKVTLTTDKALINMELIDIEMTVKVTASKPCSLQPFLLPTTVYMKAMSNTRPLVSGERLYIKNYNEEVGSIKRSAPTVNEEFKHVEEQEPAAKKAKGKGKGRGGKKR